MLDAALIILLKAVLALALATLAFAWLAVLVLCVVFGVRVDARVQSPDPLAWFAYLRSLRRSADVPADLVAVQLWMRMTLLVSLTSFVAVAVSAVSLAIALAHAQ